MTRFPWSRVLTSTTSRVGLVTLLALAQGFERPTGQGVQIGAARATEDAKSTVGHAVSGRVTDEQGRGLPGVTVLALFPELVGGVTRLSVVTGGTVVTDDSGRYRLSRLPPDSYYLLACAEPFCGENEVAASRLFFPTLYPGVRAIEEARRVRVPSGTDLVDVDFRLSIREGLSIRGMVQKPDGTPLAGTSVLLFPGSDVRLPVSAQAVSTEDGHFSFGALPGGEYVLQTGMVLVEPEPLFGAAIVAAPQQGAGLILHTKAGTTVRGRVVFESAQPPAIPDDILMVARPIDFLRSPVGRGASVHLNRDGSFEIRPVWGPHIVEFLRLPEGVVFDRLETEPGKRLDGNLIWPETAARPLRAILVRRSG